MGFREPEVRRVLGELRQSQVAPELEPLLRAALQLLAPPAPTYAPTRRRERPNDRAAAETGA
jgi:hypothetical protein